MAFEPSAFEHLLYNLLTQIFGLPIGAPLALPKTSTGIHHGYALTLVFPIVPVNFACLFSKKLCTPSVLSLSSLLARFSPIPMLKT